VTGDLTTRRDARGYSWPPFEAGNVAQLRHGAHSMRKRQPLEEAMSAWAHDHYPWVAEPRFAPAVAAWARAEAMVLLLAGYVDDHGPIDDEGKVLPAVAQLDRYERLAMKHREQLGIDPTSALRMLRDRLSAESQKADLDAVMSAGREAINAREAKQDEDDDGGTAA
jgi:hypothetical protein